MKVHNVTMNEGDLLVVTFGDMPSIRMDVQYEQALEAALQQKLQEIHTKRYQQAEAGKGMNVPMQPIGAFMDKKW